MDNGGWDPSRIEGVNVTIYRADTAARLIKMGAEVINGRRPTMINNAQGRRHHVPALPHRAQLPPSTPGGINEAHRSAQSLQYGRPDRRTEERGVRRCTPRDSLIGELLVTLDSEVDALTCYRPAHRRIAVHSASGGMAGKR